MARPGDSRGRGASVHPHRPAAGPLLSTRLSERAFCTVLMAPCPAVKLPTQGDVRLYGTQSLQSTLGLPFRVGGLLYHWDIQQDQAQ